MRSLEQLRQALGLSPADSLVEEAKVDAPATGVGHGLQAALPEASQIPQAMIDAIRAQPQFTSDPDLDRRLGITSAARWVYDPHLVVLGDEVAVAAHTGAADLVPGLGWLLDTRGTSAAIAINDPSSGETRYLSADQGQLAVGHIVYATTQHPAFEFRVSPRLELPDLQGLLAALNVRAWLRTEVATRVASASVLQRAAAAGLSLRLALGELEDPDQLFASIIGGGPDPMDGVREWVRSLSREVISFLEATALDEAGVVGDELEQLAIEIAREPSTGSGSSLALRVRRDDLESVATVLQQANAATAVTDTLKALDRRAAVHLSALDLVEDTEADPPLLGAVSAAQPEAWWGTVWSD